MIFFFDFWRILRFFHIFKFFTIFDNFWIFLCVFFMDILDFLEFFCLNFGLFKEFFGIFLILIFILFFLFFGELLDYFWHFLFKATKVTTKSYGGYYWTTKWRKISTNSVKSSVKARSSPQKLEVSPRSGLYLLVFVHSDSSVRVKRSELFLLLLFSF